MSSTNLTTPPSTAQEVWALVNLALGIAGSFFPGAAPGISLAEGLLQIGVKALTLHAAIAGIPIEEVIAKLHPVEPPIDLPPAA